MKKISKVQTKTTEQVTKAWHFITNVFDREALYYLHMMLCITLLFISLANMYTKYTRLNESYLQAMSKMQTKIDKANDTIHEQRIIIYQLRNKVSKYGGHPDYFEPMSYTVAFAEAPRHYDAIPLDTVLQDYTYSMCKFFDIPDAYDLMLTLMWKETKFDETAINTANDNGTTDYGLLQINSSNRQMLSDNIGVTDLMNAEQNICSGVYIVSTLINYYDGNTDKAIMAYNMGAGNVDKLLSRGITSSEYLREVKNLQTDLNADQFY